MAHAQVACVLHSLYHTPVLFLVEPWSDSAYFTTFCFNDACCTAGAESAEGAASGNLTRQSDGVFHNFHPSGCGRFLGFGEKVAEYHTRLNYRDYV